MIGSGDISSQELIRLLARAGLNLSAEFSTPLHQLIGPLEKLLELEQEPEKLEQLRLVLQNAYRFHSLVGVVEEIAALEVGDNKLVFHQSDVVKFVAGVLQSFQKVAAQRNIELHFHTAIESMPVYFDFAKLQRIVYTLVANAIRYSDKEMSDIRVSMQAVKGQSLICLNISDNGVGIVADKIPFLTNPFYEDPLHLQLYQSTSLSLYLIKRLLDLVGGSMNYFSQKGSGTTVEVYFPVFSDAASIPFQKFSIDKQLIPELIQMNEWVKEVDTYEILDHQPDLEKKQPLLLIFHDEQPLSARMLLRLKEKFKIILASKNNKMMQLAMEHQPDLILLSSDWNEQLKACIDFLKHNKLTAHIPLFWLTQNLSELQQLEASKAGLDGMANHEANETLILLLVQNLLNNRKLAFAYASKKSLDQLSRPAHAPSMEESFLQRLHSVIESKLSDAHPDVNDYCELMHYSRAQLHRKIKDITSMSTSNYIRHHKLKLALKDLQDGRATVSEIAYKYGFGSLAYFSRVFKSSFGLNPSEVRNKTK
jgi:AraC-like DNA-binding protein/two-component sensor histidine kinase